MKIVSRAELIQMPVGTLFAEAFHAGNYGPLQIFGGYGCGPDFTERSITSPQSDDTEEYLDRVEDMFNNGTSYPVNVDYGREGLFDDTLKYLVYEPSDIASIIAAIAPVLSAYDAEVDQ